MPALRAKYSLSHLSDGQLMQELTACVVRDRASTAELLAHIAEVDDRRLYRPAGYSSMHAYCIEKLHLSEGATSKRVTAARLARELPILFEAVADGRLHLSGISVMSKHLSKENVDELVAATTHKTREQIEILIAQRFPQKEPATLIRAIPQRSDVVANGALSPGTVVMPTEPTAAAIAASLPRSTVKPVGPQRFALQLTMEQRTRDKLRYAQELLSHTIPNGDVTEVLDRALDALIRELEKRKFAKTSQPRPARRSSSGTTRCIPAHVRREVKGRDGGQCTFVSDSGHRCAERKFLEFDHVEPFARGGGATVESMRLRCRAHNQYEAEQIYGAGFMQRKRESVLRAQTTRGTNAHGERAPG